MIQTSKTLADVKYEIRGQLAHRAGELERQGYEILSLNIGNPGLFGFRTPETMRLAMKYSYQVPIIRCGRLPSPSTAESPGITRARQRIPFRPMSRRWRR